MIITSCKENSNEEIDESTFKSSLETNVVTVQVLNGNDFNSQIISNGKIQSTRKANLRFKISENIKSVNFTNGEIIFKGQVIAVLDNDMLKNSLEKAEIEFEKAKYKLEEEIINYNLNVNSNDKDTPILRALKVKTGYLEAENQLNNSKLLYNQTFLKAPFDGIIANIAYKEGNFISSSEDFCTIISQNKMEVLFPIIESEASFVKLGQKCLIIPFTDKNIHLDGFIEEVNPLIDKNGLILLKSNIEKPNKKLFDGMNVKIIINKRRDTEALSIPKEALVIRSNRDVVFTLEKGLAKWNYVEIQDENVNSYAIKGGLKLGDTIIISGNENLSHDSKVKYKFLPKID